MRALRRILAALLLLPASFAILRGAWFGAWRQGPRRFFSRVLEEGSRRREEPLSPLASFCLLRLLPAGRELARGADVHQAIRRLFCSESEVSPPASPHPEPEDDPPAPPHPEPWALRPLLPPTAPLPPAAVSATVARPGTSVASFDVFGALLSLPVLRDPDELRHLGASRAASDDIRRMRDLARPRPAGQEIFRAAKAAGKRVVALASLPTEAARIMLEEQGFSGIDAVHPAHVDGSSPFDRILREENVAPAELFHVGGEQEADVAAPVRRGIPALRLPTTADRLGETLSAILTERARNDPPWSLVVAHAAEELAAPVENVLSPAQFGRLLLGPFLLVLALRMRRHALDCGADHILLVNGREDSPLLRVLDILRVRLGGPEGVPLPAEEDAGAWLSESAAEPKSPILVFDVPHPNAGACGKEGLPTDAPCRLRAPEPRAGLQGGRILPLMETDADALRPWSLIPAELLASPADALGRDLPPSESGIGGDREAMLSAALDVACGAAERFGKWTEALADANPWSSMAVFRDLAREQPANLEIFRRIGLAPSAEGEDVSSLERALDDGLTWRDNFEGTGFDDIRNLLPFASANPHPPSPALRIGVHIHLHNPALAQEVLELLRGLPAPFDLFVTSTSEEKRALLARLCVPELLPSVRRVDVRAVPNRGRDVAPWVVDLAVEQRAYDVFCHAHGKESPHISFGAGWRRHLLANVLRSEAVTRILRAFTVDARLGCVFPAPFPMLRDYMMEQMRPSSVMCPEDAMAECLLQRLGLPGRIVRGERFFSAGTMLWYRPAALEPLFSLNLQHDDFPEEPIGVAGTLAHALERMPALVARRTGHTARMLTLWPGMPFLSRSDPA